MPVNTFWSFDEIKDSGWWRPLTEEEEEDQLFEEMSPSFEEYRKLMKNLEEHFLELLSYAFENIMREDPNAPHVFYANLGTVTCTSEPDDPYEDFAITDFYKTYRYENGTYTEVETGTKANTGDRRGPFNMYYPEGTGRIGIDEERGFVLVEFVVGPRYGRGFSFPIEKSADPEEGWIIGEEDLIWMS